jgi:hypothetical protein
MGERRELKQAKEWVEPGWERGNNTYFCKRVYHQREGLKHSGGIRSWNHTGQWV